MHRWLAAALALASARRAAAGEDKDLKFVPQEIQDAAQSGARGEDRDLDLIPREIEQTTEPAGPAPEASASAGKTSRLEKKLFLEDAYTRATPAREVPVPFPSAVYDWQNRTSFDLYLQWHPWRPLTVTLSDRFNVLEQENIDFLSRQTLRNDFREGYLTWEPAASTYLEAGRINLRNGAALGFNPTDFFKTRTLVGQASLDPSAARQNRLGTVMLRGQKIWGRGSVSLAYAPKICQPSAIVGTNQLGVDPRFDATNAAHRVLGAISLDMGDWSSQLLGYFERRRSKVGFNVTRPLGDAVVAYAEWAGGVEGNLISRGFDYGQATGTLPPEMPPIVPSSAGTAFRNDVATGASWTIASKVTLNFEYHYHQAGFTRADWGNWFNLGALPGTAPELWYLRGYANDQQEPVSRHQIFARLAWPRALTSRLELSAFALINPLDGSTLAQAIASYYLSDAWTFALYASMNGGTARSERGSLPQFGSVVLQLVRYL
jgi:hypothetical protein